MFADFVPGTGRVSLSVALSTSLDAATLAHRARPLSVRLLGADRPAAPSPCSISTIWRAAPSSRSTDVDGNASATPSPACWRGRAPTARSACGRSGGDDVWLDAYVTDFLTRAKRAQLRGAGDRLHAGARPPAQLRRARSRSPARTAAANSPMRSTCWRGTARRRSATCATSPTSSSTSFVTPIAKAQIAAALAMLGDKTRAERVYRAALAAHRAEPKLEMGRTDYGSALRDAAALVTLASEGGAPRADHRRRDRARRCRARALDLHLDAGAGLAGAGGARAGKGDQRASRSRSTATRGRAPSTAACARPS